MPEVVDNSRQLFHKTFTLPGALALGLHTRHSFLAVTVGKAGSFQVVLITFLSTTMELEKLFVPSVKHVALAI